MSSSSSTRRGADSECLPLLSYTWRGTFNDETDWLLPCSCKKLAPIYDTLGERYSNVKDKLVIAKFDATENDVPATTGFRVTGFPTIKFKAAGSGEWISYEGDRSLESFVEFLESNATNDINSPDDLEAELDGESEVKSGRHDELVRSFSILRGDLEPEGWLTRSYYASQ